MNIDRSGIGLSSPRVWAAGIWAMAWQLSLAAAGTVPAVDRSESPAPGARDTSLVTMAGPSSTLPSDGETVFSGPIVIKRGGIYSGAWSSTDSKVPVVKIETTEEVTLTNCRLRGPGHLVHSVQPGTRIAVTNCEGQGIPADLAGISPGRFLAVLAPQSLVITHNTINGTSGIYIDGARRLTEHLVVSANKARDVDGRHGDGAGGYLPQYSPIHFLQLNNVRAPNGATISWNEVVNRPGASRVEDNINLYQSRGTPLRPIRVQHNYIRGAYPARPEQDSFSGGGIVVDGPQSEEGVASAYIEIIDNFVVSTINYGIGVASGHHISVRRNVLVSAGRVRGGPVLPAANVGLYVWDINGDRKRGAFFANTAHDNVIGWIGKQGLRADAWTPDCEPAACREDVRLADPISERTEAQQHIAWLDRVAKAQVRIGASFLKR